MGWIFIFAGSMLMAHIIYLKRGVTSMNTRIVVSIFGAANYIKVYGRLGIILSIIGILILLSNMNNVSRIIAIVLILGFSIRFYSPYYRGNNDYVESEF